MRTERDVAYAEADGRTLGLDIYRPDGESETRTGVLLLHGGGWRRGDKAAMAVYAEALTRAGFIAIAPQYRLLDDRSPWPAQLDDVRTALTWAADHADALGVDPGRLVLQGFSAGAHLSLLCAAAKDGPRPAAVVAHFAIVELGAGETEGLWPASDLLGPDASEQAIRAASPLHNLGPGFPPTLLIHGIDDWLVPPSASQAVFDRLRSLDGAVELHLFAGQSHEFSKLPSMLEPVQALVTNFLHRHVVDPEGFSRENHEHSIFAAGRDAFLARTR